MEEASSNLDSKNNFQCAICQKKLKSKNSLDHHMKKQHASREYPDFNTNISSETCDKLISTDCVLESHILREDFGEKSFKCDQCFKGKFSLHILPSC